MSFFLEGTYVLNNTDGLNLATGMYVFKGRSEVGITVHLYTILVFFSSRYRYKICSDYCYMIFFKHPLNRTIFKRKFTPYSNDLNI